MNSAGATFEFPAPSSKSDTAGGLIAIGGNLSVECMLSAYRQGIFPWFKQEGKILWWFPNPRTVLLPKGFHCSRRLARRCRSTPGLRWKMNSAFATVLERCARGPGRQGVPWLDKSMRDAYCRLHEAGHCHSFETWANEKLLGGAIIIRFGAYVSGETMFSSHADGSKLALLGLCATLARWPQALLDCQVASDHLYRLGAVDLPRAEFSRLLEQAAAIENVQLDYSSLQQTTIALTRREGSNGTSGR